MKYTLLSFFINLFLITNTTAQTSPVGTWVTIDDEENEPKSHIEIEKRNGKLYGKVVKLLQRDSTTVCEKCKGDKKDQLIVGMEIMWNLEKDGEKKEWKGGKIMDPKNGKEYKCKIKLKEPDLLEVRGYKGISLLGRTQKWHRLKE